MLKRPPGGARRALGWVWAAGECQGGPTGGRVRGPLTPSGRQGRAIPGLLPRTVRREERSCEHTHTFSYVRNLFSALLKQLAYHAAAHDQPSPQLALLQIVAASLSTTRPDAKRTDAGRASRR